MKQPGRSSRIIRTVYRLLLVLAILLALLLFVGTIYALVFRDSSPSPIRGLPAKNPDGEPLPVNEKVFSGLGRLRISLSDSAMLIFSPVFIYDPNDKAFTEELAQRIRVLRDITTGYFSSFKSYELQKMDEEALKTELMRRFNGALRLGRINIVYFNDFIIIE